MIFVSILLIALYCIFISKVIEFQRPLDALLINFILVCANIIVSFEVASIIGELNQPWVIVSIQAIITLAAGMLFILNNKRNIQAKSKRLSETIKEFIVFCKEHKFFTVLLFIVALVYIFMLTLSIVFPQNTSDSLYNHLSRIGHWLQQGSLRPYDTFSIYGITYPYNNSLLMMWSVLFLKMDRLVGFVQWFATIFLALSIYGMATLLKFTKIQAGYSALVFLTFPIVFLESVTAQNDVLVSSFFIIGLYFLIEGFQSSKRLPIVFSALSFGLAAGTKQYLAFVIPGLILIFIYLFFTNRSPLRLTLSRDFVVLTLGFTLLVGSYAYIQNYVYFGSPIGFTGANLSGSGFLSTGDHFGERLEMNSLRLGSQFISCEGLPLPLQKSCLAIKGNIFRDIFNNPNFNLESTQYMLEPQCGDTCFSFSARYPLNEESSWYGFLSWILLIPGCIAAVIIAIRRREFLSVFLIAASFIFFLFISVFQNGWNPYQGRYLILAVALITPFSGYIFAYRTTLQKCLTILAEMMAIFILVYTLLINDSKPLISVRNFYSLQQWGKNNNALVITKIAYKLAPLVENQHSHFEYSYNDLRTFFAHFMSDPYQLVNADVPEDESLGIIADKGLVMDYLFFGNSFSRKVYDLPDYSDPDRLKLKILEENVHYLLVSPNIDVTIPENFILLNSINGWLLYKIR